MERQIWFSSSSSSPSSYCCSPVSLGSSSPRPPPPPPTFLSPSPWFFLLLSLLCVWCGFGSVVSVMMIDRSARWVESKQNTHNNHPRCSRFRWSRIHKPCSVWFGLVCSGLASIRSASSVFDSVRFVWSQVDLVRFGPIRFYRIIYASVRLPVRFYVRCLLRYNSPSDSAKFEWVCFGTGLVGFCIFSARFC